MEPRKKTGKPSSAQRASNGSNTSLPETFVRSGSRRSREASTIGMPSANERKERR